MSDKKPDLISPGMRFEVSIERVIPRGLGFAHFSGKTVLVPLAAAGDHLLVEASNVKGDVIIAEIRKIISAGSDRIEPECQYYGSCGGCDFQHLSYAAQLAVKAEMIRDCIRRIARIDFTSDIEVIPSPLEFGYRSRAQLHVDKISGKIGFYKRNSRDVVEINTCPILTPELNARMAELRQLQSPISTKEIDLASGDNGVISVSGTGAKPQITEAEVAGFRFRYSAEVFFQVNRILASDLVRTATRDAGGKLALDLYSGVGLFSLPLSLTFENVLAVEEHPAACRYAIENAELNERQNVRVVNDRVRSFLKRQSKLRPDFILLDPPRAGTERETVMNIISLRAPVISFVACEPSVLARDIRRFVEAGYKIESIVALDMFPQTHHVETVARLSLA